jgi:uncharacterized membrane protein YfcA
MVEYFFWNITLAFVSSFISISSNPILTGILLRTYSFEQSLSIVLGLMTLGTFVRLVLYARYLDWSVVRALAPGIVVGTLATASLVSYIPPVYLSLTIITVSLWCFYRLWIPKTDSSSAILKLGSNFVVGVVSALATITSIGGGSIRNAFTKSHATENTLLVVNATGAMLFFITAVPALVVLYTRNDTLFFLPAYQYIYITIGIITATWAGKWVLEHWQPPVILINLFVSIPLLYTVLVLIQKL